MKQLLILSGKGGTGKTTVAGAFIKYLSAKAYADCDVDAPNLHLIKKHASSPLLKDYYGLPKAVINYDLCTNCGECAKFCRFDAISKIDNNYTISYYSCEGCSVCEFVCPSRAISMIDDVAGETFFYHNGEYFSGAKLRMGSGTSGKLVSLVKRNLLDRAKDVPFAIVDGSPGIGCPVIASLSGADVALIVAEPSIAGISDMQRIIDTANHFGTKIIVCINKYDTDLEKTKEIEAFCVNNNILFAGKIPYDKQAIVAINEEKSIIDFDCPSGNAVKKIIDTTVSYLNNI